ncbi:MAG TPA: ATP-binding protein [Bryobacteraceae bacterium]|nr:ATP-binding protein [Bryobacteraceae bacterium]
MLTSSSVNLESGLRRLLTVHISRENDVVTARQRARQLARLVGFDHQDQIRIATATSEIARNALQYAGGGRVEFGFDLENDRGLLAVQVRDEGPGITDLDSILEGRYRSQTGMGLGIAGARRLMDRFTLKSAPEGGTMVSFAKVLPATADRFDAQQIARIGEELSRESSADAVEELRRQNQEMLGALELLRARDEELERRRAEASHLNQELEETNRGVVALYAELDERATALRQADEIKTRFLSYMSHEFRTPVNSIIALSDLLLRRVDGDLAQEQEKQIEFIKSAARELFEMVNDLLDLAKVEAGKVDIHPSAVQVSELFGALRGMMRPLTNPEGAALIFDEPAEGLYLETDEGKVSQILRNLVSNALKFTEKGEVRVEARREDSSILFSVWDTGIGIAPDDQERIFHEFAQVENPAQRRIKGTGLGLPLSRKLSELLGGTLRVTSELGVGSCFTLKLPLPPVTLSRGTPAVEAAGPEADTPGSILIIDDEELARYLARQMFRGTRHLITEATRGVEGMERARFDQPRLILLDLSMPDRNGFEVLEELKADPATRDIPVVIHTSRAASADDLVRLGNRHAAVLPKHAGDRDQAFAFIRELLGEPHLFADKES